MSEPRTVLITGAGFSYVLGLPLTAALLRRAEELCRAHPDFDREDTAMHQIAPFFAEVDRLEAEGCPPDLEKLLTAIWEVIYATQIDGAQLDALPRAGEPDVPWTIGSDYRWPSEFGFDPYKLDLGGEPRSHYATLVHLMSAAVLLACKGDRPFHLLEPLRSSGPYVGCITLNYDPLPEYFLQGPFDYGFKEDTLCVVESVTFARAPISNFKETWSGEHVVKAEIKTRAYDRSANRFPLYRIHGGVNQSYCVKCGSILLWPAPYEAKNADVAYREFWDCALDLANSAASDHLCAGEGKPELDLGPARHVSTLRGTIVPPIDVKERLDEWARLAEVHERALALAESCERAVVVGASLRPSDVQLTEVLRRLAGKRLVCFGDRAEMEPRLAAIGTFDVEWRGFLGENEGRGSSLTG